MWKKKKSKKDLLLKEAEKRFTINFFLKKYNKKKDTKDSKQERSLCKV